LHISSNIKNYIHLLINLALEPEWERKFSKQDQNSYEFRIGFEYHDMIENVRKHLQNPNYFENIIACNTNVFGYTIILKKIHINTQNYNLFRGWLKENLFKKDRKFSIKINKTTCQNIEGVLFKNIVMYGIEQTLIEKIRKKIKYLGTQIPKKKWIRNFRYIRFGNNFVIFSPNKRTKRFRAIRSKWLTKVGFDLRERGFQILHTRKRFYVLNKKSTKNIIILPGFTICGFFFRHYKLRKIAHLKKNLNLTGKKNYDHYLIYQVTITPSKKKLKQHLNKLSYIIFTLGKNICHRTLIESVNPIIWNWCNYFRYYNCKTRFRFRQYITFCMLKQWANQFRGKKIFRRSFLNISKKINNQSEAIAYLNIVNVKVTRKILLHTDFTPKIFIQISKKFSIFNENNFYFNNRFSTLGKQLLFINKCKYISCFITLLE
jgi:hypothetical protein